MDLNDIQKIKEIDAQNMLSYIDGLPDQLLNGWQAALKQELPKIKNVNKVMINSVACIVSIEAPIS